MTLGRDAFAISGNAIVVDGDAASVSSPCPGCRTPGGGRYGPGRVCWSCFQEQYGGDGSIPEPGTPAGERAPVKFVSADELLASVPAEPPWRWHGYLAAGAVTVLAGKPKSGKSTLGFAIATAIAGREDDFLGHRLDGGPVVYVSEEGAATLAHKVSGEGLRIATRETAWPRPIWSALVWAARAEANRVGASVVVIDTFAFWAALGPESEKDAGAVQAAMEPLVALAENGRAVLLIAHARKGGGEDGEAVRGSSAIAGAADIVLELDRVKDLPRQRKLLALSRYPQTPGALVFEREGNVWSVVGEGTDRGDARDIASRGVLLGAMSFDEGVTRADIEAATGTQAREWHATLDQLITDGVVTRSGEGKRGDPYRYTKVREGPAQKRAESVAAGALDSAAPPIGGQQKDHSADFSGGDFCGEPSAQKHTNDGRDAAREGRA